MPGLQLHSSNAQRQEQLVPRAVTEAPAELQVSALRTASPLHDASPVLAAFQCDESTLSGIEGHNAIPSGETLVRLARALGTTAEIVMEGEAGSSGSERADATRVESFGERLASARKAAGLTQQELGVGLGTERSTARAHRSGKHRGSEGTSRP